MFQVIQYLQKLDDLPIEWAHLALTDIDEGIKKFSENENIVIQYLVKYLVEKWRIIRSEGEATEREFVADKIDEAFLAAEMGAAVRIWQ